MTVSEGNFPRLVVTGPQEHEGLVLSLSLPEMVIGHSDNADLVLDDRFVSRRHALITVAPTGSVTIHDLNSTGGTFVNEERLRTPRVLQPGDVVRFADLVARFEPADVPRYPETTAVMPVQAAADTGGEAPLTPVSAAAASDATQVINWPSPGHEPPTSPGGDIHAARTAPSFRPLPAESVARALAALPAIQSNDADILGAVRKALARAIASGQDASQLGQDLAAQGIWLGADLKASARATSQPETVAAPVAASPSWAQVAARSAVQADSALRVAVLDRDPSTVSSLSVPVWAIGQMPAGSYGPVSVADPEAQVTVRKWIIPYIIPAQMVSFVQGATTLFVAPVADTGNATSVTLAAGSVWINVASFAAGAPPNSFAGIAGQGGSITCDQALTLGGSTVTVPDGASLTLTVTPAAPGSQGNAVSMVAPPNVMSFAYPDAGAAAAAIDDFTADLYDQIFNCTQNGQPAVYDDTTKTLAFPCSASQAQFAPAPQAGMLLSLSGSAPLEAAGWALQVAQSAPLSLGNAASAGLFYLGFGAGLSAGWPGLSRPEPQSGGIALASTAQLMLWTAAGLAPDVSSQLRVRLWDSQEIPNTMTATRVAGTSLVYEVSGANELIELGAGLTASLDRLLLAGGIRALVSIPDGLVILTSIAGNQHVLAYAAFPAAQIPGVLAKNPDGFPMALDNALINVSAPLLFVLDGGLAKIPASGNYASASGALLVGFLYKLEFPFFPDPYTGAFLSLEDSDANGGLLAEMAWTTPENVTLRLADLQHPHPVQPPPAEASTGITAPESQSAPSPGTFTLGSASTSPGPAIPAPFPFQPHAVTPEAAAGPAATIAGPEPIPVPPAAAGLMMLDVSTRASQFGVEIVDYNLRTAQDLLTIDGLSARTYAVLAPVITLPAISWEPMHNQASPEANSPTGKLLRPPDDGPVCGAGVDSVTLVPISPIQSLGALLAETQTEGSVYGAVLTLPYGAVAGIAQKVGPNDGPAPQLTQPSFSLPAAGADVPLAGAYQLTLRPPLANPAAPLFTGRTYLRTQEDNPSGNLSYGEEVLGFDVAQIFSTDFNNPGNGVPAVRYDLTGYGASLFSDWTDLNPPHPTAIIRVNFVTTVGRTSHEIIQAQSVIHPHGVKTVRTITMDRLNSGSVERTDTGWLPASDGDYTFTPTASGKDIIPADVHMGVIDSLVNVRNIQEFGLPLTTPGTSDADGSPGTVTMQPVTFDADIAINPLHQVVQGGSQVVRLDGLPRTGVPSTGMVGYICLTSKYHLSLADLLGFLSTLPQPAGGPMQATLNLGGSNSVFRSVAMSADAAEDTALSQDALVLTVRGLPVLPAGSAWTVALKQTADPAPRALAPTQSVPVVQPNTGTGVPGAEIHFADPSDIFRLAPSPQVPPANLYGFLQDVTTQKTFLAQPYVVNGMQQLLLRQVPSLADPGALLGAVSSFPAIASALPLTGLANLPTSLGAQSLSVDKWFDTDPGKVAHLIQTPVAVVDLVYRWSPAGPEAPQPNPNDANARIHITLGQSPPAPTWSIDIYEVALKLTIPPVSGNPALWIEGAFHADSQTLPSFPDLQVVYDGPLAPLTQFFTVLNDLGSQLGGSAGGGGASPEIQPDDAAASGAGLNVHYADGVLTVQDTFALPQLPLGPGTIENISLDLGANIDIVHSDVGFLVGIGSPDAPVHWIVDPLSGTGCLQAGVQDGSLAVLVQLGLGLGLAIDLAVASGSASITIAFQVQISGTNYELLLLLTGQAQVTVLGGVASAAITLSCGLGLEFQLPSGGEIPVTAIGTASVGIHISICWVVSIDFSGSWSFSHQFQVPV